LFKKLKDIYSSITVPELPTAIEESSLRLQFSNGSRVIALPGSEQTIRGFSGVALAIIDEAAACDDALFYAIKPMLAVSAGRIILLSTPRGKRGFFHQIWAEGSSDWKRILITALDCPRISASWLEAERRAMPDFWFRQEFMCEFCETIDSVFSYDDIEGALDPSIQPLFGDISTI
jgi:phage FluMu gp28-like protein